jgi:hypothetical protein
MKLWRGKIRRGGGGLRLVAPACAAAFLLCGCVLPQGIETGLSACPPTGLASLAFYRGAPASGAMVAAERDEDALLWRFGNHDGNVYAVCRYRNGEETVQKLPSNLTSCRARHEGGELADIRCTGSI